MPTSPSASNNHLSAAVVCGAGLLSVSLLALFLSTGIFVWSVGYPSVVQLACSVWPFKVR